MLHVWADPYCVNKARSGTNTPELRQERILQHLMKNLDTNVHYFVRCEDGERWLERVHDADYISFMKHAHSDAMSHRDPHWLTKTGDGLVAETFFTNRSALAHLPVYKRAGFYQEDVMSPIYANTYEQALSSAYNSREAATFLFHNTMVGVVYCANVSPGHHAHKEKQAGYCVFNNGAVAADRLVELGAKRVAILDVDMHAGQGTSSIFWDDRSDVCTISIHADPTFEYPSYAGFETETRKDGFNLNVCLRQGTTWDTYAKALKKAELLIRSFAPQFLVVPFGADTLKGDPDSSLISGFHLMPDDFQRMGAMIASWKLPTLVTQEGGYDMDRVGACVGNLMKGWGMESPP